MSSIRQAIELTARMYEMQTAAKNIFGEQYHEKVQPWIDILLKLSERLQCSSIEAALHASTPAKSGGRLTDGDVLLMTAALVELEANGGVR